MFYVDNPKQALRKNNSSILDIRKNYIENHDQDQDMSIRTTKTNPKIEIIYTYSS